MAFFHPMEFWGQKSDFCLSVLLLHTELPPCHHDHEWPRSSGNKKSPPLCQRRDFLLLRNSNEKQKQRLSLCILSDSLFPKKTNYVTKIHHIIIKSVAFCCVARASNCNWKWIFIKRNILHWNNATFCNTFWANQSNLSVFFQVKRFKTTIKSLLNFVTS